MKVKMFDPPSGWKYGFPKAVPKKVADSEDIEVFKQWLIDEGYPKEDIDFALAYGRHWFWDTDV